MSIKISKSINVSRKILWKALTDPEEMKKWYFDVPEFKPREGLAFEFSAGNDQHGKDYVHQCKILEVIPYKLIKYSWEYKGHEGYSDVAFKITDDGSKSELVLIHSGVDNFPSDNPDLSYDNFVAGWKTIIGDNLDNYLKDKGRKA